MQRARQKRKNQYKARHDLLINHVFVSFFAPLSPLLLLKRANRKTPSTFFLVSNFLCSFRINLELFKAGDAMSSPAIVSLTELTHTFLLFETRSCCKNFNVTSCLIKNSRKLFRNPRVTLVLRISLHFISKSKRIIKRFWETTHLPLPEANINTYFLLRSKC